MPSCETSPTVGLSPTTALLPDGQTIEPSRLGADGDRAQVGGRGDRRAGARAARIGGEVVRVPGEAAPRAPAVEVEAGRRSRPSGLTPRKFAHSRQVRLAEDDRAGRPQARHQPRVARDAAADQGERAGGRLHRVVRRDVVLDQDRDAVERTPDAAGPALRVTSGGDVEGGRVRLDDRVEDGVEALDPVAGTPRSARPRTGLPGREQRVQLRDRCLEPRSGRVLVDGWDQRGGDATHRSERGPRRPGGPSWSGRS